MTTTRTTKTSLHSFNKTRSSSLTISTQNLLPPFPVMISWESQLHITIPTKYVFASLKHKKYYKINSQTRFKTTKLSCSYGNNCPPKTLVKNFKTWRNPMTPWIGRTRLFFSSPSKILQAEAFNMPIQTTDGTSLQDDPRSMDSPDLFESTHALKRLFI